MGVTLTSEMINGAIESQNKYGVPASVTLGQILLESGGGYAGGLSGLAYYDNNLFGIKAGSNWNGKTVTYKTTEYKDNTPYTTEATFRKYDSIKDSIEDHAKLLSSNTYTSKTKNATNLTDYVNLMGSVYATSPTYSKNLLQVINDNNLTQYDTVFTGGTTTPNTNTVTVEDTDTKKGAWYEVLLSNIIKVSIIILLIILSVVFLMQSFGAEVSPKKIVSNQVKKKTGVDIEGVIE